MKIYESTKDLNTDVDKYKSDYYNIIGSYRNENNKLRLVVECEVCKQDPELFKLGLFDVGTKTLKDKVRPCGCSVAPQWEEWQYKILLNRRASLFNCEFLGWSSDYIGSQTRTKMHCTTHNITWDGSCINDSRRYDILCSECHSQKMVHKTRKPDDEAIKSFKGFAEDTIFTRSDKKAKNGHREYWDVQCPECAITYTSNYKNLIQGYRGCECNTFRQKQVYLHILYSEDTPVGVKFGIANNWSVRFKGLNKKNKLRLENYAVWEFNTTFDCRKAEQTVKDTFSCGVIPKEEMPDGYTETASLSDFGGIVQLLDSLTERNTHTGP